MRYPKLPFFAKPYFHLELPGWGRIFRLLKVCNENDYYIWRDAPQLTLRGKWCGTKIKLNLSNWSERHSYFLGRYYDLPTQLLFFKLLKPGDRVIDVGANIGMLSFLASKLVGEAGLIESVEPNPTCALRIRETASENHLKNLTLHEIGLSDVDGEAVLRVLTDHTGMGTVADIPEKDLHLVSKEYMINVRRGDSIFLERSQPLHLIKIDVEGLEMRVLRGLEQTIQRSNCAVTTEIINAHLQRDQQTAEAIREWFKVIGYSGYILSTYVKHFRRKLRLTPLETSTTVNCCDIVWLKSGTVAHQRLQSLIPAEQKT